MERTGCKQCNLLHHLRPTSAYALAAESERGLLGGTISRPQPRPELFLLPRWAGPPPVRRFLEQIAGGPSLIDRQANRPRRGLWHARDGARPSVMAGVGFSSPASAGLPLATFFLSIIPPGRRDLDPRRHLALLQGIPAGASSLGHPDRRKADNVIKPWSSARDLRLPSSLIATRTRQRHGPSASSASSGPTLLAVALS
jgi:hypothetical protein